MKTSKFILSGLLLLSLTSLVGCNNQADSIVINILNDISLKVGETHQIEYEVKGKEATKVIFSSEDTSIASVTEEGLVRALKEGTTKINLTLENDSKVTKSLTIKVSLPDPEDRLTYGKYVIKEGVTDLSFIQGYPWLNTSLEGTIQKIEKPSVKDDFFAHVNYESLENVTIPEGKTRYGGLIYQNADLADQRINEILTEENSTYAKFKEYYIVGAKDFAKEDINKVLSLSDDELATTLSSSDLIHNTLSQVSINNAANGNPTIDFGSDSANPTIYLVITISQLTGEYEKLPKLFKDIANAEGVTLINDFENTVADTFATLFQEYNSRATQSPSYVKTTVGELSDSFNGIFNFEESLNSVGYLDSETIYYNQNALDFIKAIEARGKDFIKKLIYFVKIYNYLNTIGLENYFKLYKASLSHTNVFYDDNYSDGITYEAYVDKVIPNRFVELISKDYCEKYITESSRTKVDNLIKDIIRKYRELLLANDWLSEDTINKAVEKLDAMRYVPFYEDGLVSCEKFVPTATNIIEFKNEYGDFLRGPFLKANVDTLILKLMTPYTVNAAYLPMMNAFIISHAICANFIDDSSIPTEMLYGFLGGIIGHEISHGFDSTGSQFDKDGKQSDWWTPEDKATFNEKVQKLVDFYNNDIRAFNDTSLDGNNLKGEVIADMGGAKVITLLGEEIDGFDFKKMYESYANFFGYIYKYETAYSAKKDDPHPLSYLRTNVTLAQYDKFLETFDIEYGDLMYIELVDRIAIW